MFCPNCGKELPDNASFCDNCGANLNGNTNYESQGNEIPSNKASIKSRNLVLAIILSLVTCGFYTIYWFICLANDINKVSKHENDTSGLMAFLLGAITCGIYMYIWAYKAGNKMDESKAFYNLPSSSNSGVLYLILSLLGLHIVAYALIQNDLNKMSQN